MELTFSDCAYLGYYLQGFFFGLYSGIFVIYLQNHVSQKNTGERGRQTIIFYALCLLYALSTAIIMLDMISSIWINGNIGILYHLIIIEGTISACCDFIAQSILIYRCWVVWQNNICVVIVPSILALVFLAIFITTGTFSPKVDAQGQPGFPTEWSRILVVTGLALSMIVNALVTGLILFKILQVSLDNNTADDQILGTTSRSPVQRVMFALVESGMILFSMHLARLVLINVPTDAGNKAYQLITSIQDMVNGITPTIIWIRVSIGSSFDDRGSMEASIGSLRFASDDPNSILETGDANIVDYEQITRNNDSDIDGREMMDTKTKDSSPVNGTARLTDNELPKSRDCI